MGLFDGIKSTLGRLVEEGQQMQAEKVAREREAFDVAANISSMAMVKISIVQMNSLYVLIVSVSVNLLERLNLSIKRNFALKSAVLARLIQSIPFRLQNVPAQTFNSGSYPASICIN